MYQTKIFGDRLYHCHSEGYGSSVELFGFTKDGETPMSLVSIALGSCITMCIQAYFARLHQKTVVATVADVTHDEQNDSFKLLIRIQYSCLSSDMKIAILDYINEHCHVKQILRSDIVYDIQIEGE